MLRSSLTTVGVLCLSASALAQLNASSRVHQATTPRDGGTYHLGTQTWTRKAQMANLGAADVIYDNTCTTGYFSGLSGDRFVDEGRLPSTTSPQNFTSRTGCQDVYNVDGFQIAYCTDQVGFGASTTTVNFYNAYGACATAVGLIPAGTAALTALPGSLGTAACWIVTIDPVAAFPLTAGAAGPIFGWSIENDMPAASQLGTGPIIAADDSLCARWSGTRWDNETGFSPEQWPEAANLVAAGTGMGTLDQFRIEPNTAGPGSGTTPGCYFFGGAPNPYGSFHLELYDTDACGPTVPPTTVFCFGDGSGTACPCGNNSNPGDNVGCLSSLAVGGRLRTTGSSQVSNDTLVLVGDQMPSSSCLYFQGLTQISSVFGDGLRCAGGTVIRLGTKTNVSGASQYPAAGDVIISIRGMVPAAGGVRTYQAWYRNAAAFCTASTFNLSNGVEATWVP